MRVLHVSPYSGEAWAYGGIPRVVEALTDGLAALGHAVTVCTTDVLDASSRLSGGGPRRPWVIQRSSGVEVRIFPNASNRLAYHQQLFLPVGLRTFLKRHVTEVDVAHLHACRNVPGALAAAALTRARVPYVLAPNGTAPNIERRHVAKHVFDALWGTRVLRGAARVLAVTRAERAQLQGLGVPEAAIRQLPNPVDLTAADQPVPRGDFRRRWGLGDGPLIVFLGKLTPRKRVDVLLRAFAARATREARLVIAGNDMGSRAMLEALAVSLGISRVVTFTGLLRGSERLAALADADVVVYPSAHEIFGLVPCEALLAGTPVVVADDSGCGEILGTLPGVATVRVGDVEGLSRAMDGLLARGETGRDAARRGGDAVRQQFAPATVCAGLEAIYAELL